MLSSSARGGASTAPSPAALAALAPASVPPTAGPWRYALSIDRRWALVCDADGRNLVELHRPALATGPVGRPLTFEQVVRLMSVAPQLLSLLGESLSSAAAARPDDAGRHDYRDRVLALLAFCR